MKERKKVKYVTKSDMNHILYFVREEITNLWNNELVSQETDGR